MISVVIPVYNKGSCVLRTINSVLAQAYVDFELLVIDDGSTDNSFEEIKKVNDPRVRVVRKQNGGVSSARNLGIREARFEYIAFLDGDDIWMKDHLQVLVDLIHRYASVASIFATEIRKTKTLSGMSWSCAEGATDFVIEDFFCREAMPLTTISSSSFAVKKEIAVRAGMFDEGLKYGEDVDFWYRIVKSEKVAKSTKVTAFYFLGAENRSDKKIIPLDCRFHKFYFAQASRCEKFYLGKLVCLILIDYFMLGAYAICFKVLRMYKLQLPYVVRYLYLLVKKRSFDNKF